MQCRICHQNSVVLPPSQNVAETLLRPIVQFAFCNICFTDVTVRGRLLLGPRLVKLKAGEVPGQVLGTQRSAPAAGSSVDEIAADLQRRLTAEQLDQLTKLLAAKS